MVILPRRDNEKIWEYYDPILKDHELVVSETASGQIKYKYGNGKDNFTKLPYLNSLSDIDFFICYIPNKEPITIFLNPFLYDNDEEGNA